MRKALENYDGLRPSGDSRTVRECAKGGYSLFRKEIPLPCTLPEKIHIAGEQLEELRRLPNRMPARGVAAFSVAIRFGLLLLSAAALPIL